MRHLTIGESTVPVETTPLAILYFRQEFGCDMTGVFCRVLMGFLRAFPSVAGKSIEELRGLELDPAEITPESLVSAELDALGILQLVWAMAKAAAAPGDWPGFEKWLATFDGARLFDDTFLVEALQAAADGLFHGEAGATCGSVD